ncbi:MAG: DUF1054 family protein [Deltaproteobacteria bacterium]|nr:DUF1054 family protein [Deltaproteobacteria bacterium]
MIILTDSFVKRVRKLRDNKFKAQVLDTICELGFMDGKDRKAHLKRIEGLPNNLKRYEYRKDGQNRTELETHGTDFYLIDILDHSDQDFQRERNPISRQPIVKIRDSRAQGFATEDFEALKAAFEIPDKITEDQYFERLSEQIYPKFGQLAQTVPVRIEKEFGVRLFPHLAEGRDVGRDPVVWLAFTDSKSGHYANYCQLTLQIGLGDCLHEPIQDTSEHFSIKLAVFGDKQDIRRFWMNVDGDLETLEKIKKYARKLDRSYKMKFYRKKKDLPVVFPANTNDDDYLKVIDMLNPESIDEGFFGFSFSKDYRYYEDSNAQRFADIKWVENEIVNEFSKLMYLYFIFSKDDPMAEIESYKERKIQFDNRRNEDNQ